MSAIVLSPEGQSLPRRLARSINHKEARYISARLKGLNQVESAAAAGVPYWAARSLEYDPRVQEALAECTAVLAESALTIGLCDALELHEQLSAETRGAMGELYDDKGELLPVKQWPLWAQQGGVEILDEPNMVPSKDEGGASWDQVGRRIKVKSVNRAKAREQLGKLKAVNAFVEVKQDTNVNVVVVTAERARAIVGAKKRLAKVVDVLPVVDPSEDPT